MDNKTKEPIVFRLNGYRYVDAGGNQIWKEKDCWYEGDIELKNPFKQRESVSIAEYNKAYIRYRATTIELFQLRGGNVYDCRVINTLSKYNFAWQYVVAKWIIKLK